MPYYSSPIHVLRPNDLYAGGTVILPWLTWDWLTSFEVNHNYDDHPLDVLNVLSESEAVSYVSALVDRTLAGSSPFGFVAFNFEFFWVVEQGKLDFAKDLLSILLVRQYDFWAVGDVVSWFRNSYSYSPAYSVVYDAVVGSGSVEWYYSRDLRVARVGGRVVSYVSYSENFVDPFLSAACVTVNFSLPCSVENSIDYSLPFEVDALGGGLFRAPASTGSFAYAGALSEFRSVYVVREASLFYVVICAAVGLVCLVVFVKRRD